MAVPVKRDYQGTLEEQKRFIIALNNFFKGNTPYKLPFEQI